MSAIRPGNHDRAWNDPPQFAYAEGEKRPRTLLNKRVQYTPGIPKTEGSAISAPIDIVPVNINSTPVSVFTPECGSLSPPACPSTSPIISGASIDISQCPDIPSEELLDRTMHHFTEILEKLKDRIGGRKMEDIERKLSVMKQQWSEGKLCDIVKKRVYLLSLKLQENDVNEANTLQVSLIVDYSSEVSQWMVGVKHIIRESQSIC